MNPDQPAGPGSDADADRKTRKLRISDYERTVLIRSLETQIGAAETDEQRSALEQVLKQITPKRRRTTSRMKAAFQVSFTDADSGEERDCGHTHASHLEAQNCANGLARTGISGQVVPVLSPADE